MKATAHSLVPAAGSAEKSLAAVYADLFKARLTFLVLLTTLVGFYLGSQGKVDYLLMVHTVFGTALVACGAGALNQLIERDYDARMKRTMDRPLPAGRLLPNTVLAVGVTSSVAGLIYLVLLTNLSAAVISACSLLVYLFIYTPLKRVTWLNTAVGAIPGGLPPLIGWASAQGGITPAGWSLFGILAAWQLPHFMAIAWLYREEYLKAGFKMLSGGDRDGRRTGRHAVVQTVVLALASCIPFVFRQAGLLYLCGAVVLGLGFLWAALRFARELTMVRARQLFLVSILYLPLLLALLVVDKLR